MKVAVFKIDINQIQTEAPLYTAVRNFLKRGDLSFHVPLHGGGSGASPLMRRTFASYMKWDLTELGGLDDLHLPLDVIQRARELAADLFQAKETFFLVNGVTAGLQALFLALCRPGDKVLLSRLSHKAALHGILLAGALPVYLPVEQEPLTGFPLNLSPVLVEKALQEHPDAKVLLLTSPSYWGVTADLSAIKKIAAQYGVILAVDEAHGTHLPFYPEPLPHSAAAKVDIWLHSAHKSLGSLTPGAFLHTGDSKNISALRFWLQALQTSSPSYPLMVSLDLARRRAALQGGKIFAKTWEWALCLRLELTKRGFKLLTPAMVQRKGFSLDPCRLTLLFPEGEGQDLAAALAGSCQIQVELQDRGCILMIVGPSHLSFSPALIARALTKGRQTLSRSGRRSGAAGFTSLAADFSPSFFRTGSSLFGEKGDSVFPPLSLPPRTAFNSPSQAVSLKKSPGRVCSEMVIPSPPGIPVLSPGEMITEEVSDFLLRRQAEGKHFQGAADHTLQTIKVVL